MTKQVKHRKAYRCRIDHTGMIYQLKENSHITTMPVSYPLEQATTYILKEYPKENIIIKSDKGGGGWRIVNGSINRPHPKSIGNTTIKDTTQWLRLIKSDGTVWAITDDHHVGEKLR